LLRFQDLFVDAIVDGLLETEDGEVFNQALLDLVQTIVIVVELLPGPG